MTRRSSIAISMMTHTASSFIIIYQNQSIGIQRREGEGLCYSTILMLSVGIMVRWVQCAFTRRCMTLKGVGRKQHLPEQGVLSVLIMNHNISLSCSTRTNYFPHFWSDKNKNNTVIPNAPLEYDMTTFSEASGQPYTQKQLVSDCLRFS